MSTYTVQPAAAAGKDSMLFDADADGNYGAYASLYAGKYFGGQKFRALLLIDMIGAGKVPAGAVVSSAILTLTLIDRGSADARDVSIHRGLVDWPEGTNQGSGTEGDCCTWNNLNNNGPVPWNGGAGGGAGSDYVAVATDTVSIALAIGETADFDVTADVQAWADGDDNHGWWLLGDEGVDGSFKTFASSDHATAAYRPELTVEYETPGGNTFSRSAFWGRF